jgi:hypothetical protein
VPRWAMGLERRPLGVMSRRHGGLAAEEAQLPTPRSRGAVMGCSCATTSPGAVDARAGECYPITVFTQACPSGDRPGA